MKCELDRIVSKLGNFELSFEEIVITEYSAGITVHKGQPVGLFERGIVVSFLNPFFSLIASLSPSFASSLASSDEECLQGVDLTGLFGCCVVVQEKLHKLYDQRIVDKRITNKHTGRNLLNWAVSTSLEDYRMFRMYRSVTTGTHHCCPEAVKQGRHC